MSRVTLPWMNAGESSGQAPPPPGSTLSVPGRPYRNKAMHVIKLDLANARNNFQLNIVGAFYSFWLAINRADGSVNNNVVVNVAVNDPGADALPMVPGSRVQGYPFASLYISNAAVAGVDGYIVYSEAYADELLDVA